VVPVLFLIVHTVERFGMTASGIGLLRQLGSTLAYSSAATICVVVVSLIVLVAGRFVRSRDVALSGRVAAFGYAVPGTVLAIGLLGPLAGFDNLIATLFRDLTHQRIGLILMGSGAALVIAYTIRFLTIGLGGIGAGFGKASPSLDDAARVLGRTPRGVFIEIHWPLLKPAIAVASVLVFIDAIKELPATLLLRPLNVETLATHVYSEASRGLFENGAPAALLIVLAGILPAIISMRLFDRSHGSRA
jgi:iron(III) transport system permease protein